MSDPKRYSIVADYQAPWAKMHEFSAGGWVKWEDYARLKAEVEHLKEALNKMTKTPDGVYGVDLKVNFWTKYGSRLPSSYQTFWTNEAKEGKQS